MTFRVPRAYKPFHVMEEHKHGMWRRLNGDAREPYIVAAADLMRDPEVFEAAMLRGVREWPESSHANLSVSAMNRRAWMGHAGCCITTGSPEELNSTPWYSLGRNPEAHCREAIG